MKTIDARLDELTKKISDNKIFESYGLGNEINFHVFDYDPLDEYYVRDYLDNYLLSKKNLKLQVFNIYEIILEALKVKGFLDKAFEYEKNKGTSNLNNVISKTLGIGSKSDYILNKIRNELKPNHIVILTGIGQSYGIIRGHTLLNNLHSIITENPVIMMYPGEYNGQSFRLFNKLDNDNYYRAFQFVSRK